MNENLNPIETIQGTLSKNEIEKLSNQISNGVKAGIEEPLDLVVKIEFLKKALDMAKKSILSDCIDEAYKFDKTGATIRGVKIQVKEAGVKYNYSNTEIWNETNEEIKQMTEVRKSLEGRLKAIKGKENIVDDNTGEVIELNEPIKTSTTTIAITFPK
tara:strand:+ start:30880 stop:31353 length:474 start_codon:yes stop_codon:yes gene_type:complete